MKWIVWHSRSWFMVVLALASCTCTFSFFRSFFIYRVMPLNVVFFFFSSNESFLCLYFSQSVPYAHTLVLTVSCSSSSLPILPPFILSYIPPFFFPHLLRPIHVFPPCTNQVSPCHLQAFCYSLSWWATGTCAPWSGGKNWPDLHNNRKCQIYRVYTIMMHSRTLSRLTRALGHRPTSTCKSVKNGIVYDRLRYADRAMQPS